MNRDEVKLEELPEDVRESIRTDVCSDRDEMPGLPDEKWRQLSLTDLPICVQTELKELTGWDTPEKEEERRAKKNSKTWSMMNVQDLSEDIQSQARTICDKALHAHIIVNAVHPITGKKLHFNDDDYTRLKDMANEIGEHSVVCPCELSH